MATAEPYQLDIKEVFDLLTAKKSGLTELHIPDVPQVFKLFRNQFLDAARKIG